MVTVTAETPLKDITDYVDLREFFLNKGEDIRQDSNENLHIECPNCGGNDKCYVYIANVYCHKCRSRWSMYEWLTTIEGMDRETAVMTLQNLAHSERLHAARGKKLNHLEINDDDVERMNEFVALDHAALTYEGRQWWHSRGVSDEAIQTFKLGENKGWMCIPLRDDYGTTFGIKKRWHGSLETSPHNTRYECVKGSKVQFAPLIFRNGESNVAIIVGGEIKGLALWSYLRNCGVNWTVVAVATGENPWPSHWNQYMKFSHIAIWPDQDQAGFDFATSVHRNFRSDLPMVLPEGSGTKAVDDFILAGGDAISEIAQSLGIRASGRNP